MAHARAKLDELFGRNRKGPSATAQSANGPPPWESQEHCWDFLVGFCPLTALVGTRWAPAENRTRGCSLLHDHHAVQLFKSQASEAQKRSLYMHHFSNLEGLLQRVNRFVESQVGTLESRTQTVRWNSVAVDSEVATTLDALSQSISSLLTNRMGQAECGDYESIVASDHQLVELVERRARVLSSARAHARGTRVLDQRTVCGVCGGFVTTEELTPGTAMNRTHTAGRTHATLQEARNRLRAMPHSLCGLDPAAYEEVAAPVAGVSVVPK